MAESEEQFVAIWNAAITKYQQTTKIKLQDLDLYSLQTVADLEQVIDRNNGKITEFREKRGTLFKALRNALFPIQSLSNLAGGAASIGCPPSGLVFGAVSCLVSAADDVSSNYDSIQDLMGSLQDFTVRLQVYKREHISPQLQMKLTEVLTTLLDIFAQARKGIKRGRLLEFGRSVVLGKDPSIKAAVGTLEKLTKAEDMLVGAETRVEVSRQGRAIDGVAGKVSQTQAEVNQGRVENREMHDELVSLIKEGQVEKAGHGDKIKIKKILDPRPYAQDTYKRLLKARSPGTGDWIFQEKIFKAWADKSSPLLFISGMPGAGKSFLSTNIVTYFMELYPQGAHDSSKVSICYFYFQDKGPDTRSIHQALRDMAFQIYSNDAVYAKYIDGNFQSFEEIKTIESAWQSLFVDYFVESDDTDSTALLILDGLDEAYDKDLAIFLPLLQDLGPDASGTPRLQVTLVGRPHLSDEIADALESDAVPTISVDATKNSNDIANYIQSSIKKSRILRKVSKNLQNLVISTLTERANGMFLWVDLMLRQLNDQGREPAIRKALEEAPKGLHDMISHVLQKFSASLSPADADDLNELLAWVTCAKRPLALGDLDAIIKYKSPTGDGLIDLESLLRKKYASFFLLTREDGLSTADLLNLSQENDANEDEDDEESGLDDNEASFESNLLTTEVAFCHASIGDFFRDKTQGKVRSGDGPPVGVDIEAANIDTLETMIKLCVNKDMQDRVPDFDFVDRYCGSHWQAHMAEASTSKASDETKSSLGPLLVKFCRDESVIEKWSGFQDYQFWFGKHISTLRKWLEDEKVLSYLEPGDQDWIRSTTDRPAAAFEAVAKVSAKKWLQTNLWLPSASCWFVFGYIQSKDNKPAVPTDEGFESALQIEETASWAGFEKTAYWYRRVGAACRDCSFLDDAQKHFETALELDPTVWRIKGGLSLVAIAQKDLKKAIEYIDEEIEVIKAHPDQEPEGKDELIALNLETRGDCYYDLGEEQKAYESYREASILHPLRTKSVEAATEHLDINNRPQEIMELIKLVFEDERSNKKSPYIVKYGAEKLDDQDSVFLEAIRRAARETGELSYLIDKYREGIDFCRRNRRNTTMLGLEMNLADIYYTEKVSIERGVRIWERISQMSAGSSNNAKSWTMLKSTRALAKHYFSRARESRGLESAQYVSNLEAMAKSKGRKGDSFNLSEATMILGGWYRLDGREEEAGACFKVHIKQALQLLSDDDPENDGEAYLSLSNVLVLAGDEVNGVAMYQKITAKTDEVQEDKEESKASEDKESKASEDSIAGAEASQPVSDDKDFLIVSCDGVCPRSEPCLRKNPFWMCRYCLDTVFCEPCFKKLQADELPINVCSPKHSWIEFTPTYKILPPNQILVGDDQFVNIEQWKKDLKRTYGL